MIKKLAIVFVLFASVTKAQPRPPQVYIQNTVDVPIISGLATLTIGAEIPNCCSTTIVGEFQLTVDGVPSGIMIQGAPSTIVVDTLQILDGVRVLSFIGLPADVWPVPGQVVVDNIPGPATQSSVLVCGYSQKLSGIGPGMATNPACFQRALPLARSASYPHVSIPATPTATIPLRGDLMVEHVIPNTALHRDSHFLWRHRNGEVFVASMPSNFGTDYRTFPDSVDRFPLSDGPRGVGFVSPYITGAVHPVSGELYFVEKGRNFGRLGRIQLNGTIETLAGYRLRNGVVPCFYRDSLCDHSSTKELIGDFSAYPTPGFHTPYDLSFDLADPTKIYVADFDGGIVAQVDLSTPAKKVTVLASGLSAPMSVSATDDGVWVLERGTGNLRKITATGAQPPALTGFLTGTSVGDTFCIRSAGHGSEGERHVYLSNRTGIYHFRPSDANFRLEGALPTTNAWVWFDVDRHGELGPAGSTWNHLFVAIFSPTEQVYRFQPETQTWTGLFAANFQR